MYPSWIIVGLRCCFIFMLLHTVRGYGQDVLAHVSKYGVEDGISHREVYQTLQDKRGFIWLATKYGINRFDGHQFKWWTKEKNGLANNEVNFLLEDQIGNLWAFTTPNWHFSHRPKSLSILNSRTGEVLQGNQIPGQPIPFEIDDIISFIRSKDGTLYFTSIDNQLYVYKGEQGFRRYSLSLDLPFHVEYINEQGHIWGYTGKGSERAAFLVELNANGEVLRKFPLRHPIKWINILEAEKSQPVIFTAIQDNLPPEIFQIKLDKMPERLNNPHFDEALKNIGPFWDQYIYWHQLSSSYWFKGDDYLSVIHPEKGVLFDFTKKEADLVQAQIHSVFFDREGRAWIGTENGLYQVELRNNKFTHFLYSDYDNYQVARSHSCRGILVEDDQIWVNTYKGQICLTPSGDTAFRLKPIPYTKNNGIRSTLGLFPLAVAKDSLGNIWSGEFALIKQESKTNKQEVFRWPSDLGQEPNIWSILIESPDNVWLGTTEGIAYVDQEAKLLRLDHQTNQFDDLADATVYAFVKSRLGHYWLATNKGLFAWQSGEGILEHWSTQKQGIHHLPHEVIYHLHEDQDTTLWLASGGGGLIKIPQRAQAQQFTIVDGLSNNNLYAIYEDQANNLWMSSDFGLIQFHKNTELASAFLPKDGITHNEFNRISHYQADDGRLYFGGMNGVTAFHPSQFHSQEQGFDAPLEITDFQQFDSESGQLLNRTRDMLDQQAIQLEAGDRFFRLGFALLAFSNPDRIRYAWMLEGYDNQWNHIRENFIRISGLPAGKYRLKIKGQAPNGRWSKNELYFPVVVLRPFYETTWFWAVISLLTLGSILILYRLRTHQLKKNQLVLERLVQERTATIEQQAEELRQLDRLKSRFFANVSHELRTPLSLLLGPISSAIRSQKLNDRNKVFLNLARQNGKKLLQLVNEILDLSKLEAGKLKLEEKPLVLLPFLRRLTSQFESHAQQQGIEMIFEYQSEPGLPILMDAPKFEVIFNNLLSNALKYTPNGGRISICLEDNGRTLVLSVNDTGPGIHPDDLPHIFDRFYQSKLTDAPAQGGTGIGLALSREYATLFKGKLTASSQYGKGASFAFEFPKKEVMGNKVAVENIEEEPDLMLPNPAIFDAQQEAAKSATVLLVEDNHSLRQYIKIVLGEKYHIRIAENGRKALESLSNNSVKLPDLIISDVMMPIMDGFQLIDQLKGADQWRHIPVIMLTARAELRDRLKALRTGVDDYMLKPFEEEELLARVGNLLERYDSRRKVMLDKQETQDHTNDNGSKLSAADAEWLAEQEKLLQSELSNSGFTSSMWAIAATVSERQLQRKLKALTGLSPHQYLSEVRLLAARRLLEDRQYRSVAEVAYAVGYSSSQSFTRNFRKRFGRVPSDYLN